MRFRFAPTPSRDLHVGNALAALFGWASARAAHGAFVLRIEDIDRTRCKPAYETAIYRDLSWLGVDWDEGPDVGGPYAPYRQSQRLERYDAILADLRARGLAYVCTCSRADIRAAQSAPHAGGDELPYPGTCRDRDHTLPPDRGGIRFRVDAPLVDWTDGLLGARSEDIRTTSGDVLLGRPGQPTYQLAVVADDIAMHITDVVRGVDLIGSTARQIALHRALGAAPPRYLHHPLLLDGDDRKLSKRDAAIAIASLCTSDPSKLVADLGRAIGLFGPDIAHATAADWVEALPEATRRGALTSARWPLAAPS